MLLYFAPSPRTSTLAHTFRVTRDSKHIATVTRGVIRPKRPLTKDEHANIRTFIVTTFLDTLPLKGYPAIREMVEDAFQTWPEPRRVRRVGRPA